MKNYFDYAKMKQVLSSAKVRKICFLSAGLIFVLFIIWLVGLFITPGHFRPVEFISDGQVSQYLTNRVLPELYNKSQFNRPFEIVFTEQGINDIVSRHIDANSLRRSSFSDISVTFKKGRILLASKMAYHGFDFVVTAVLKPYVNKKGYFSTGVKIQAGTSSIPFAANMVKRKVLYNLSGITNDSNIADYAGVFLSGNKIVPEFSFNHRSLRIEKIVVRKKELIVYFLPG